MYFKILQTGNRAEETVQEIEYNHHEEQVSSVRFSIN